MRIHIELCCLKEEGISILASISINLLQNERSVVLRLISIFNPQVAKIANFKIPHATTSEQNIIHKNTIITILGIWSCRCKMSIFRDY